MEFRDATPELLTDYKDQFDFDELGKLAIDYSDGVIQAVPDASKLLCDYAAAKNKPLLEYHEDFGDAYEAFYESLYADEAK
jgi:starch synthase